MLPSLPSLAATRTAVRSVRALLADPEDLPKVFTLLEALSGNTLERIEHRLAGSEPGRRLLTERPNLVPLLEDREALRRLPAGTLGRAYLAFVESENISAAGIMQADVEGRAEAAETPHGATWVSQRMRDTHDLWHAVTGYKGDVLGELALLAFTLAQTWNPGIGVLVATGLFKTTEGPDGGHLGRALILEGFRRGLHAAWLPEQPWETMLALPVAEVRAKLGTGALPVYTPVYPADLRARMAA